MLDPDYDNDDNQYIKLKMRMTTKFDGEEAWKKEYIHIVKCDNLSPRPQGRQQP